MYAMEWNSVLYELYDKKHGFVAEYGKGLFDVVFSNAVFHWINDHDALLKNIHKEMLLQRPVIVWGMATNLSLISLQLK